MTEKSNLVSSCPVYIPVFLPRVVAQTSSSNAWETEQDGDYKFDAPSLHSKLQPAREGYIVSEAVSPQI